MRKEQRRNPRFDVSDVRGTLLMSTSVRVINLSLDGLALETHNWLHTGRSYSLKIAHGQESLRLDGEVVWCHLIGNKRTDGGEFLPIYRAGVHFGKTLSDQAEALLGFLQRNAIIEIETRVFGRFKVSPEAALELDSEREFTVRRMSLSGMLIEADFLPDLGSRCPMELELNGAALRAAVRVAHVKSLGQRDEKPLVEIGVEFAELSPEGRAVLDAFVSRGLEAVENA